MKKITITEEHPNIKKILTTRSDRVKSCDLHPTEQWLLVHVHIWDYDTQNYDTQDYDTQKMVRRYEVSDWPVRAAIFVARKSWVVTASDDGFIRVFNHNLKCDYSSFEQEVGQPSFLTRFQAHSDYMRSVVAHPYHSLLLTCGDDMMVKVWNWENNWVCQQVFKCHSHYVMAVRINPENSNIFATASLDKTVKVWELGSTESCVTLEGHTNGVFCV